MATLTPLWTATKPTDPETIKAFLAAEGIDFETWPMPQEAISLAAKNQLDPEDKERLLSLFRKHLDRMSAKHGYVEADVIAIRANLPGIDDALAKFDKVHYHDDDEVRAIVGGCGIFGFIADNGRQFLVEVGPGDYLSVPAGMWHWFYCLESRNITALRLFKDTTGWVPHYRKTGRATPGMDNQ